MIADINYNSDWKDIMASLETIESKGYSVTIKTLWNEFHLCSFTQVGIVKEVGEMSEDRKVIYNSVKVYEKHTTTFKDKKQAVVAAINDFLHDLS